jgi:hypothetical protein
MLLFMPVRESLKIRHFQTVIEYHRGASAQYPLQKQSGWQLPGTRIKRLAALILQIKKQVVHSFKERIPGRFKNMQRTGYRIVMICLS